MAIEGPLKELGIHDVFQLLDLNRKTGVLTVTSPLRQNRGNIFFDRGEIVYADIQPDDAQAKRDAEVAAWDLALDPERTWVVQAEGVFR